MTDRPSDTEAAECLSAAIRLVQRGDLTAARSLLAAHAEGAAPHPECLRLLAKLHNALGDKAHAVTVMQAALRAAAPSLPQGQYELGVMLLECGRVPEAVDAFAAAVREDGDHLPARFNLAWALRTAGRMDEAADVYAQVVARAPDNVDARYNLANLLLQLGRPAEAIALYEQARLLAPANAAILLNLGIARQRVGRYEAAEESLAQALRLAPDDAEVLAAYGSLLSSKGDFRRAVALLARAQALAPDDGTIACNHALALMDGGDTAAALAVLGPVAGKAGELGARALNLMGVAHSRAGRPALAESLLERAVALSGGAAEYLNNLGQARASLGRMQEALAAFRQAHQAAPDDASIHSNLLFALCHHGAVSPEELFAAHREFGRIQEGLAGPPMALPPPVPLDGRRLRVGYVSPDFREHAVAYLIEPVLAHHDKARVEVFCYATRPGEDAVTQRLKQAADHWRDIGHLPPDVAAALIRDDRIDVLIDLAGHSARNALPVFARKPAPIQITWLGYPATTGLSRMDYRFGLGGLMPGVHPFSTEMVMNVGHVPPFREPLDSPDPVEPPMLATGRVTFGSVNKALKVSGDALETWCRILARVPSSRLIMVVDDLEKAETGARVHEAFARHGIPAAALVLRERRPLAGFLELLNEIDICLDPFPYGGGTTTLFASWMGVPTVTLAGDDQRQGTTSYVLRHIGAPESIAGDVDAYVEIACGLAASPDRLSRLRSELRARMLLSPMMDGAIMAHSLEYGLRRLWAWHMGKMS